MEPDQPKTIKYVPPCKRGLDKYKKGEKLDESFCSRNSRLNRRTRSPNSIGTDRWKSGKRDSISNDSGEEIRPEHPGWKAESFSDRSFKSNWRNRSPKPIRTERINSEKRYSISNDSEKEKNQERYAKDDSFFRGSSRGRGRGNYRGKRTPYFAINPRVTNPYKLDNLSNQSPSEILLTLTDPENGFNDLIQQSSISNEIIAVILKLIVKGFTSEMHQQSLHKLMGMLLGSNYLQIHIPMFVSSFLTSGMDLNSIYNDLINMYEALLHRMPNTASETLNPSILLCTHTLDMLNKRGKSIDEKHCQRLVRIQQNVEEILENTKEQKRKQRQGTSMEERPPPNNFRDVPIIPTADEIITTDKPFLRKNITDGKYDDVEHYLDVQFRLLREDFIAPLRLGICDYLQENSKRKKQWKFQDVRLYERVRVNKIIFSRGTLLYQLIFDKTLFRRIKWETSRRLIFGSLLCLSADDFRTIRFASVVNREMDKLKDGIVEVKLENEDGGTSCMTKEETQLTFTMAESPAFFEAYRHVLLSLKMINSDTMPFQDYIVHMKTEHTPPAYLRRNPVCDLSFMLKMYNRPELKATRLEVIRKFYEDSSSDEDMYSDEDIYKDTLIVKEEVRRQIIATDMSTWPTAEDLGLDDSQRKAMQLALSSSVAVIQGPPGTGKTYVGLKIVEALLRNNLEVTPILVVCFTNHALDQFLEGMLSYTTDLVRVGGRSENEALSDFNLKKKQAGLNDLYYRRKQLQFEIIDCQNQLSSYKKDLKYLNTFILHERALEDVTQPDQTLIENFYSSFENIFGYSLLSYKWQPSSILAAWLGLTPDDLVDEYDLQEFYIQEVVFPMEPVQTKTETEKETKEEELGDAADSDDDVIDVEDEASTETKNRMLDTDYDVLEDYEIAGNAEKTSHCWSLNVDKLNDLYHMYGLENYKNIPSEKLLSSEEYEGDPNVQRVLWLRNTGNYHGAQEHFDMVKIIAERELKLTDAMEDTEVNEQLNVWTLSLRDRWRLYRRWVKLFQEKRKQEIEKLQQGYRDLGNQLRNVTSQQDYNLLKDYKVIGMTTTGAAKYQPILYEIGCKIVIIEEAAEVLETHIISSLNPHTQHLILIGDHLQLRPKPTVFYLAKKFNLDVSLFERLIKNGLPYETLQLQHRMRPEISRLIISHIYPSLLNHPSVHEYPHVCGMKNDIFFVTHSEMEQDVGDNKSHENKFEAEYLVGLCRYLLHQGYEPKRITIITMYIGQVFAIRRLMPKSIYEGVRVVAVDNYQGEENDVILLSLVRSNEEGKVGFVKIENRINVALSRARHGLYVIGNFQFLADNSDLWKRLMADLNINHLTGPSLNIVCRNHPESQAFISKGIEFQQYAPEGGCVKKCDVLLSCGHICPRVCHLDDHGKCTQRCAKQCPEGHPCPLRCFKECEPCEEIVRKSLLCGHSADMKCSMEPEDYNCLELVEITLPYCQHRRNAECYRDVYEVECLEDCEYRLDCGHKCELKCHPNDDPEHIDIPCYKLCEKTICKQHHKKCTNKCCEDCSICQVPVDKTLPCGHQTEAWCGLSEIPCDKNCKRLLLCGHQCKKKCSEPCTTECKQRVEKELSCGHSIKIECFLKHENIEAKTNIERLCLYRFSKMDYKCQQPCCKILPCGHLCQNLCYEKCTVECKEIVTVSGVCKHEIKLECRYSKFQPEILSHWCEVPCSQLLPCEHQCPGTCGKCRQGRVHAQCLNPCGRVQICGHSCEIPCAEMCPPCNKKCPTRCLHTKCPNKCGYPCRKCKERCEWKCRHYRCNRKCGDDCDRPPCNEPCPELLRCRHPCIGLCGEPCPTICRECDPDKLSEFILSGLEDEPDARFIQLEDCRHCFEVSGLDHWMNMDSEKIQMKSCPRCKTTIWRSYRYGNIIRECMRNVQTVKKRVCGALKTNRLKMKQMQSMSDQSRSIKRYFPKHVKTLMTRLNGKYTLNHVECAIIENQILLLEAMAKVLHSCNKCTESDDYMVSSINFLADRLMSNEQRMSECELSSISKELKRIRLHASLILLEKKILSYPLLYVEKKQALQEMRDVFDSGKELTEDEETEFEKTLKNLQSVTGLGISTEEKVMIVKVMGLKQGAWYKCPNGHIYAIGECGGAMEQSKCNECGAMIGGSSHRLLDTNAHAGEMDGSRAPAWPMTTDIRNYDLRNMY